MRRRKITIGLLSMMMAVGVAFSGNGTDVSAASKLTVNRVYENSTKIVGKTRKKNTVRVQIGKKTYKAKANKKGKFSIKIPKAAVGKKYTLKSYKGKRLYKKKTVYVIAKKLRINKYSPNSKSVDGYTRPSYKVEVKLNNKTYVKKASAVNGYWKVVPGKGRKVGTTVEVKVKDTKGKVVTREKEHIHNYYKPVYKKVHHDEVGHYEITKLPANDETGTEATTKEEWVVDKKAYDEKVLIGYKCDCGKEKVIKGNNATNENEQQHEHDYRPVYEKIHHDEVGHYETVEVPGYYETKEITHDFCLVDGRDLTQDYLDSVKNKTYPVTPNENFTVDDMKRDWGWTEEDGYPKTGYDASVFTNEGLEVDKFAPTYSMYMGLQGWNGECDGHRYTTKYIEIKIYHEATTKQKWVVDQKAYDEKVLVGYKCRCGVEKENE